MFFITFGPPKTFQYHTFWCATLRVFRILLRKSSRKPPRPQKWGPRPPKMVPKAPKMIPKTYKICPRITKKTTNHPTHPFNTLSRILWPGGMREAIKSAAPRRGAGRVLNFGIYSSDSYPRGSSRMPPDAQILIVQALPFSYFSVFLPISFFYNFLTFSTPFLPVPDPPQCSDLLRIPYDLDVFHVAKKLDFPWLLASQNEPKSSQKTDSWPPRNMIFSVFSLYAFIKNPPFPQVKAMFLRVLLFALFSDKFDFFMFFPDIVFGGSRPRFLRFRSIPGTS